MRVHEARLIVDHWGGSRSPEIRPSERIEAASLRAAHLWVVVASLLWLAGLVLLVSMLWAWFGHHALA
jgi:hypothetical protein